MRKVLMMLLCSLSAIASATDYYVSSSGNDSSNGTSPSTPWQSIAKVNSVFSSLFPGDRILFKRGDVFRGTIKPSRSGISGNPIVIGAYGTGSNPVISGFTVLTGWTNYGNGIYSKSVSCESSPNMVTVNGVNTPLGRWPNSGFMIVDSHVSNTSVSDADLPSSPNWSGAEVVIRKMPYVYDRSKITSHSGSTLQYTSTSEYAARDGFGYFIQNDLKTLDKLGEWYYDGSTFYMYFGTSDPNTHTVKVSSIDQLAIVLNQNYITFDNISFEGANLYALQITNSGSIGIQFCTINFTGNTAIYGPYSGDSPDCKITGTTISNSNNIAIQLKGDHTAADVSGNLILNTGLLIGMGVSGNGTYVGLEINGDNSMIKNNTVENTGYIGINFSGNNTVVSNNFVNKFNQVKNDGGGIYTYIGTGTPRTGQKITGNIILNGTGLGDGLPDKAFNAHGIYMDDRVRNVIVTDNTVAHCNSSGVYLHNAHEIDLSRNILFDNGSGNNNYGGQILFVHDTYSPDDPIRNVTMNNNTFFARETIQKLLSFCTSDNDISSFGSADYNCYAKPLDNSVVARTWIAGWNDYPVNRSLADWKSFSGKDQNSFISPVTLSDPNKIRFEYNASNSSKTVALDASYIDVRGSRYSGSVTLAPYTSVVLMVDPNPTAPPAIPAYVSSSVENTDPATIIMNYNLNLANIVPAASAFAVTVNSSARTVSSVKVSGTQVLLTLSSPVAYGNTVTVAYSPPSTNPLQTSAGGKAAALSAQGVTNRVAAPAVPVYTGSSVENASPSVLVMNYNLTLANIVPAASAFTVTVNSSAITVSSVKVSGTQVLLTLSSPVAYGNTVTVAYSPPSTNPLQTSAGGKAAALSAQGVTNRVAAPAVPVYTGSSVENASPSVLVMNYNLTLANIVPAASAFTVTVNSAARTVSSVRVSGTQILLTLSAPVTYGQAVTISYTVPATNPVQSPTGGKAAAITQQPVTNRVAVVNIPPVVVVDNPGNTYSGFVNEINASGSHDANNDKLTYTWKVPANISVSSTSGAVIQFLSPVIDKPQNYEFTLTVSDGKSSESKVIPVQVLPYQPGLEIAGVDSVVASGFQPPYSPYNIIDGNIGTMWAVSGVNNWVILKLKESFAVQHVKVAFQPGQRKESYFDIQGSQDRVNWETILTKSRSCAFSGDLQVFDFPPSKTGREYNYIRLVGLGNSADSWNYISEFRIFGNSHRNPSDYEEQIVKIYPNPAHELVNILIDDQSFIPDFIKIISLTGKILFHKTIEPGIRQLQIPLSLKQGVYIIQMGTGGLTMFTQKLVVHY